MEDGAVVVDGGIGDLDVGIVMRLIGLLIALGLVGRTFVIFNGCAGAVATSAGANSVV